MKASSFLKIGVNISKNAQSNEHTYYYMLCGEGWYTNVRKILVKRGLTSIFKKLDAFIPALSLLLTFTLLVQLFFVIHKKN